ncbi:diacylglycerol/lipid kinase family protein [Cryptosporangium aurantiacum]|uniref:Diacylglycerol kinase family enzyme n=1 Tax=Cryptosporangium aurantiacum TaxID=134849 RepID=A0A1M7QN61_9ACTN|nr:diacylglycerol kinase family protein [Cryptosporangium aurantiacum]SHN32493.1 Diacylglycerol kinase family enzyme [Cryptosporangium aurantiacum]
MRALLVVNPIATTTRPRTREVLVSALSAELDLEIAETTHRGHAIELGTRAAREHYDVVVALGGDGTVNEVVNGLLVDGPRDDLPALGVVPGGSANVFIRALGAPRDPVDATGLLLEALRANRRRSIGLGQVNDRWFIFCAGFGLDAAVVGRVEQARSRGRTATPGLYVRSAVAQYFRGPERTTTSIELKLDAPPADAADGVGAEPSGRFAAVIVQNCSPWTYLGPRPVNPCPEASFDAGLDLLALRALGLPSTLRTVWQILSPQPDPHGRHILREHDLSGFVLRSDAALAAQVDGDYLGELSELRFTAVPNALRVVV